MSKRPWEALICYLDKLWNHNMAVVVVVEHTVDILWQHFHSFELDYFFQKGSLGFALRWLSAEPVPWLTGGHEGLPEGCSHLCQILDSRMLVPGQEPAVCRRIGKLLLVLILELMDKSMQDHIRCRLLHWDCRTGRQPDTGRSRTAPLGQLNKSRD